MVYLFAMFGAVAFRVALMLPRNDVLVEITFERY